MFFANNTNVTIRGTVRGRVTVVVAGPALSATAGNLRVNGSLVYANGTNTASAQDSFAALASNNIQIDCTIDPPPQAPNNTHFTVLNGVFSSVNSGQVNMVNATGGGFAGLKFYGTRTNLFTLTAGGEPGRPPNSITTPTSSNTRPPASPKNRNWSPGERRIKRALPPRPIDYDLAENKKGQGRFVAGPSSTVASSRRRLTEMARCATAPTSESFSSTPRGIAPAIQ